MNSWCSCQSEQCILRSQTSFSFSVLINYNRKIFNLESNFFPRDFANSGWVLCQLSLKTYAIFTDVWSSHGAKLNWKFLHVTKLKLCETEKCSSACVEISCGNSCQNFFVQVQKNSKVLEYFKRVFFLKLFFWRRKSQIWKH